LAESIDVLVALITAHSAAVDHLALLDLAVLQVAADVVEERGLLVVALLGARLGWDHHVLSLGVAVGDGVGNVAVLRAGDGLSGSDLFLDKILLVELRVGALEVVVLRRYLNRLVRTLAPDTSGTSTTASASTTTSGSILYPHLVHFLCKVIHVHASLRLLLLLLLLLARRSKLSHGSGDGGSSGVRGIDV
jgi:hypothetical protein